MQHHAAENQACGGAFHGVKHFSSPGSGVRSSKCPLLLSGQVSERQGTDRLGSNRPLYWCKAHSEPHGQGEATASGPFHRPVSKTCTSPQRSRSAKRPRARNSAGPPVKLVPLLEGITAETAARHPPKTIMRRPHATAVCPQRGVGVRRSGGI